MNAHYPTSGFKTYDIRGRVPEELNESLAWRIGFAYASQLNAKRLIVGHDIRLTSPVLAQALAEGICAAGCDAWHIGQCGTEEVYYASFSQPVDGGICVTASHNPKDYNGMKLVTRDSHPITGEQLTQLREQVASGDLRPSAEPGQIHVIDFRQAYDAFLLEQVDVSKLKPLRIVTNPGHGGAGDLVDRLARYLPFDFIRIQHHADGHFPTGVPNPLLPENRAATQDAVLASKADLGIAWDGDFDRCFFFDEQGQFVEGYYIVGLLAEMMLQRHPGATIVHDPRLYWNTHDLVSQNNGTSAICKTGHAFIKQKMRETDAVYGGEMSAHHYFKDFAYCDNGTLPWLLLTELLCRTGKTLSQLISERQTAFPCSGEINLEVLNSQSLIEQVRAHYRHQNPKESELDGLDMDFGSWRFNLRQSNTEPLIRLNVEARNNPLLLAEKTRELKTLLT
ncbi:phosphomannomutase/phosphoglucomutase [Simiduia agarivorans]|uniref:phosphomannomutase n=1 Tax=Simiduia agarivorans (strain DSM 21679 / JCM 13881 / BCRC 17597 / SA1) TaxID=1117647 RepID=K4L2Q7_SIMAS|nr:phosphomannomutase/phosphoglucomutase [Simiduia agarivorans]AFV00483.1 phosphoglucomutase/phosphomannomutase family protein [Simiduia agarivorans SA1 = DSM 21679]